MWGEADGGARLPFAGDDGAEAGGGERCCWGGACGWAAFIGVAFRWWGVLLACKEGWSMVAVFFTAKAGCISDTALPPPLPPLIVYEECW